MSIRETLTDHKNKVTISALTFATLVAIAYNASAENNNVRPEHGPAPITAFGHGEEPIGRSESGWIDGAATRAVEQALKEGIEKALSKAGMDGSASSVQKIIDDLPTYTNVGKAIEKAGEDNDFVPDPGDLFTVDLEVTAAGEDISYEITDATIIDIPNNQQ